MRICLDLRYRTRSGASSYIHNLVPRLFALDRVNGYVLVKHHHQKFAFESKAERVIVCPPLPTVLQILWTNLVLPRKLKKLDVDLYHALKLTGNYWRPQRTVLTAHSIMTSAYKGHFPSTLKRRIFLRFYAHWLIARAGRTIAVSEFIKTYLTDHHGADPAKIDVIYHGIDPHFRVMEKGEAWAALDKLQIKRDFLLCVGNVFPVKNHLTAVRAFAAVAGKHDVDLVIAGATNHPYCREVEREIEALKLGDRVRLLGFTDGPALLALMNAAKGIVLPSLTEGCPVTLLEAYKCGMPAIVSRRGGLEDLGKDIALFVDDPFDHKAFAAQMDRLLSDESLQTELRTRAIQKSAEFTWEKTAAAHLQVYEALRADCRAPALVLQSPA